MTSEEEQTPWVSLIFKMLGILVLTLIPTMCLFTLLLLAPWMPYEWIGPTLLISGFVFFLGAFVLFTKKNLRIWAYALLLGFATGMTSLAVATLYIMSFIPVPIVGNAACLTLIAVTVIGLLINGIRLKNTESLHSGMVTTSSKASSSQAKSSLSQMFQRGSAKFLALELEEIPHDYALGDEAKYDLSNLIEKLQSVVRLRSYRVSSEVRPPFPGHFRFSASSGRLVFFSSRGQGMMTSLNTSTLFSLTH
ncbi:MAG: hypothetical protein ACXADD_13780 [Candidatus Thorarchaeota archaeon]|jgi:hypothetical protein